MSTVATFTCYIQPIRIACEAMAWVDPTATAVVRREVRTAADALAAAEDARAIARAMGGPTAIKKIATVHFGNRAPAGVRALQGNEVIS